MEGESPAARSSGGRGGAGSGVSMMEPVRSMTAAPSGRLLGVHLSNSSGGGTSSSIAHTRALAVPMPGPGSSCTATTACDGDGADV